MADGSGTKQGQDGQWWTDLDMEESAARRAKTVNNTVEEEIKAVSHVPSPSDGRDSLGRGRGGTLEQGTRDFSLVKMVVWLIIR